MQAAGGARLDDPGRVALVGAGAFGRFCIDSYQMSGDLRLLAVADPDPAARAQVRAPGVRLVPQWRALLDDGAIEAIHVATPPYLRAEIVDATLRAGKSVFCEKPLALSLEDAGAIIRTAESRQAALGVNYVMRHVPTYLLLERLSGSPIFGDVRTISFQNFAQAVPPAHWFWDQRKSGGILVEHGVHFFDAYARIAGAAIEVWGDTPRSEAVDVRVRYAGGGLGRFYHEFAFPREIEHAVGITMFERGRAAIQGWIPTRLTGVVAAPPGDLLALADDLPLRVTPGPEATAFSMEFPDRERSYRDAIVAGMRDLVRRHRDPAHAMRVTPEDARRSLALALAARLAVQEGRHVAMPSEVDNGA